MPVAGYILYTKPLTPTHVNQATHATQSTHSAHSTHHLTSIPLTAPRTAPRLSHQRHQLTLLA